MFVGNPSWTRGTPWISLVAVLCACGPSERAVTLAELDASGYLDSQHAGRFALGSWGDRRGDTCPVLSPSTTATMNGEAGRVSRGGVTTGSEGDRYCSSLDFHWDGVDRDREGVTTFVIADETASWTFEIWRPYYFRRFELPSHPNHQIRPGDEVRAQVDVPEDGPLHTRGFVRGKRAGEVLFHLEPEAGEVTLDGHELRFIVPAIGPGDLELWIEAVPTVRTDRCDAPAGCEVEGRAVSMLDVAISG